MVVVINYGSSNIQSVINVLEELGEDYLITQNPEEIRNSNKIILPGVGSIEPAMLQLSQLGLIEALNDAVIKNDSHFLGICLGMQMLFSQSEEGEKNTECLGWLDGNIVSLNNISSDWKVPHMGWSGTELLKQTEVTDKIKNNTYFYYCHSYYASDVLPENILMQTKFNQNNIVSAVNKDNIYGIQFHPERSGKAGTTLIENFLDIE